MTDVERPRVEVRENKSRKHLLAEGVFHLIGERIVSGELAPGDRIRDADLAKELAISRTPVREALQRLERIGLVVMYPSRYTEVSELTPEAIEAAHAFAGYQAGIIARLACPRLTEADVATMSGLIAQVAASIDDDAACSQARRDAVGYLAERTGNPLQQALVDEASVALARALRVLSITPAHRPSLLAGCVELDAALRSGDADAAERAVRAIYGLV
ncbi:GntR family transcriptional regulator [Microbacterium suwonense]|uniref:Transcriptional regulator, GntR family protein n=1 Tax=Microbacterium suwonense TaxID=683047 RepID=A0ABM8FY50_9MICO|nr:GntR family transcriptional regulator [Microbacterium suwonense]BDZ40573.1 putative transcriptional regulator, GntR family protein [Microbacterium suwonense]